VREDLLHRGAPGQPDHLLGDHVQHAAGISLDAWRPSIRAQILNGSPDYMENGLLDIEPNSLEALVRHMHVDEVLLGEY